MINLDRHIESKYLNRYLDEKWLLNLYILKHNSTENISDCTINSILNRCLLQLESECISTEFNYLKMGFVLLHFGQKGVALNIWHIGLYNSTYEIFCCNWYCYNRNIKNMELLDSAEPRVCHYEIPIVIKEFENIRNIVSTVNVNSETEFKNCYIETYKT